MVVLPSFSERLNVLSVSGQSAPHDSVVTTRSGGTISLYTPRIPISVPLERRQTKRHVPPSRRSISHTGMVQPSGPNIQFGTCSGFVNASKTSLRGASTTRVMTTSRSDGVVNVVVPALLSVAMLLLLFFHALEVLVESLVARVPETAIVLRPLGDLFERRRFEPAGAPLRLAAARDEAGALEHAEVLGNGRAADRERRGNLFDRGRAGGEAGENRAARRVGEGGKGRTQVIRCHLYITTRLTNRMVIYDSRLPVKRRFPRKADTRVRRYEKKSCLAARRGGPMCPPPRSSSD